MTTFTVGKSSPNKSDTKTASLAMKSRQQVINEVNKRRTLLQDNSWIKKRPEEENADENYGKVVLNQYKSQDSLHRNADEEEDQKALLSRYRSDTTLDRISGSSGADKANKLPSLDSRPRNSKGSDISGIAGSDTSPVKKKRQSWMPPPVSSQKPSIDEAEEHKRSPSTSDKSGGPKMIVYSSDPVTPNAVVNDPTRTRLQICPPKPSESIADKNAAAERTGRLQICPPKPSESIADKNAPAERTGRLQICPPKPSESVTDKTAAAERTGRRQDLDKLIEVKAKGDKSDKRGRDLDDLIDVNNTAQRNRRSQELDDLIVTKSSTVDQNKKRRQDLDSLIEVKAKADKGDKRHQNLDDLIKVNGPANSHEKGGRDLDDLIDVNNMAQRNRRSQELDDLIVTKSSTVDQNKKRTSGQGDATANISGNQSDKTHSYQTTKGSSYNGSSSKDTIVYTRTYENSSFPRDAYEDSVSGKSIKTVYSTSDRAVIDKEMCTYCRKPLGTDTKMILDTLQICCHATCFKCEVCKGPLESLKAGDSIWIYKNTVHCSPCYSDVKASWVY